MKRANRGSILDFGFWILDSRRSARMRSESGMGPRPIQNPKSKIQNHFRPRRGFNLIELLIALSITAALLTAVLVSLNASFMAYQTTTEVASTHTIGRLAMHRMLTLIRTGQEFGPFPLNPLDTTVESDFIEFVTPDGQIMSLEWVENEETLYVVITDPGTGVDTPYALLEGVKAQYDEDNNRIYPFTLQYAQGRNLYRATIDLALVPDDNMSVALDGDNTQVIRLVASAMPRLATY